MWIHHGFRALIVLLIALAVPWLFPRTALPEFGGIEQGVVGERTVIAAFDFEVPKAPQRLADEIRDAESSVTPILKYDPTLASQSIASTQSFFARVDTAVAVGRRQAAEDGLAPEAAVDLARGQINATVSDIGITLLTDEQLDYLMDAANRERLLVELEEALDLLRAGVISGSEVASLTSQSVVVRQDSVDRVRPLDEIGRMESFFQNSTDDVRSRLSQVGSGLFSQLIVRQAQPTLVVDVEAIRQEREIRRLAVPHNRGSVMEGESIINQNEVVGELEYQRLQAYQAQLIERGMAGTGTGFLHDLGMVLLLVSLLGVLVFTTYTFHRDIYEDLRSFTVLLGLIVIVLAVAGVVAKFESPPALIPIAFAGLLTAALFDSLLGLVVVSTIAGILLGQPEFSGLPAPMIAVAGGVTGAFAVQRFRARSQSWVLIALISGAYVLAGLTLNLTGHYSLTDLGATALFGFGNATVCTALAMGAVLPALEVFTGRTTEQSLLELADMNRPLLRRLSREAPGTYAHSINLANLVEAACEAIGANPVLGRVGVYYHDIGKLERPQYFIENQPQGLNPHDRLSPWQSAEILRRHVSEGLRMADEARLPEVVKEFIREHHGTQTIRYFLEKARADPGSSDLDPNDFAYPGPKPQTKETGVAMLGDAVESASRTLTEPSPERIRALIDRLVQDRVDHGELDECGLTFRDLGIVKQEFAQVLTGLYHHRIDYPTPGGRPELRGEARAVEAVPPQRAGPGDDQAAQGDTGPVPKLDPVRPAVSLPEGAGSGRPD